MIELTEQERVKIIEAACEAQELFDPDELERFAESMKKFAAAKGGDKE